MKGALCLWALALVGCASAPPVRPTPEPSAAELLSSAKDALTAGDGARAEQYALAARARGASREDALPIVLLACTTGDRYDTALFHAQNELSSAPRDYGLRVLVATLELATGRPDEASNNIDRLLAEWPERAEPHYLQGVLARDHMRSPELAAAAFRMYLRLDGDGTHADEARQFLLASRFRHKAVR